MVTIANFGNNFIVEIFKIAYNALTVDLAIKIGKFSLFYISYSFVYVPKSFVITNQ